MTQRERLIEILRKSGASFEKALPEEIADHLLSNGVIVPPCKVGDKVYYFSHRPFNMSLQANTIYEADVIRIVTSRFGTSLIIQIHNKYGVTETPEMSSFGKTVFLTREEAEKALAERSGNETEIIVGCDR